ncbi:MAG: HYR domain-containing protein [Spirosomataceae bacterium]
MKKLLLPLLLLLGLLPIAQAQAPANDDCASATVLTSGTSCTAIAGTTVNATQSIPAITCATFTGTADDDVWYQFTAVNAAHTVSLTGGPGFDAVIDVRSGACNGSNIGCADATVSGGNETVNLSGLTVGATYYVRIYSFGSLVSNQGTFNICVTHSGCPTFSSAPANVTVTNSSCNSSCIAAGGSITAPAGTPCPAGSTLQYQVDGGAWTTTLPVYNQAGPPQSIKTRCSCNTTPTTVSAESAAVVTAPANCSAPPTPTITPSGSVSLCAGGSVILTSSSATGNQWYKDGTLLMGETNQTYTATTTGGYTVVVTAGSCSSLPSTPTVVTNDTQPPTITCPANITAGNDPNQCGAVVNFPTPSAGDNCGSPTVTQMAGPPSGSFFPVGSTITITFKATDAADNTATCSFTVTVNDTQPPTITCPANITVCEGEIVTFATPTINDNCPGPTVMQTAGLPSGSVFPVGITTNAFTATDASGNTASCSFTVTVKAAPTATLSASKVDVCPNTEVTLNPNCSNPASTVQWNPGAPTVTPNAPDLSYTYKVSCTFDGCTGAESSIEVRTHRILADLKNVGVGVQPKALAGAVQDNLAPTNTINMPTSPRLWTIVATGCSASESGVFKLSGPVTFSSIDNNPPYALFANVGSDYFAIDHPNYGNGTSGFPNGTYTLTVELRGGDGVGGPFPKNRVATGPLLATRTLQFILGSAIRQGVEETSAVSPADLTEEAWLSVGQNPVSTEVVVRLSGKIGQTIDLSLTNLQGQTIQQRSVVLNSVQQYEVLNVAQAASGMYILKGVKGNQAKTLKVVKLQ